jgi:hypothetical protein
MVEDVDSRVLQKVISGCAVLVGDDSITISGGTDWESYEATGYWVVYNIQTFDLSGYSIQERTLFPQGVLLQDMQSGARAALCTNAQRATIVSTTPLSESDLTNFNATTGQWHQPGSNASTHSLDNIIQGRLQQYLTLTTLAGLQQVFETTWGAGDSSAADKMWMCDAWIIPKQNGNTLGIPDQAFVMPVLIAEEPELEYLMRLSRSLQPVY